MSERGLLGGVSAATLATALFVAHNGLLPVQRPFTFGLVFWAWHLLFGLIGGGVLFLVATLATRVGAPAWCVRAAFAVPAAAVLGAALLLNGPALAALLDLPRPARFAWGVPAAAASAALGLAACATLSLARRGLLRALTSGSVIAGLVALAPGSAARGHVTTEPPRPVETSQRAPLVLIGLDGADWAYLDPLIARGELKNLAALKERGAWGPLATIRPSLSPVVWTTIVTGQPPERHGIESFTSQLVRGVQEPLPPFRRTRGLGLVQLRDFMVARGAIFETAAMSSMRRVPAYWNLATVEGSPVDVVNWWATWPAEPVLGRIVSERVYYRRISRSEQGEVPTGVTWPPELEREVQRLVVRPEDVAGDELRMFAPFTPQELAAGFSGFPAKSLGRELPHFLSMLETDIRVAGFLVEGARRAFKEPADLLLLCRVVDQVGHTSMPYSELVEEHLGAGPEELRKFSGAVTQAYRAADALVGRVLAGFGADAHILIVSDHGFRLEDPGGGNPRYYGHGFAPAGIFLAAGPGIRPGRAEGLSVGDLLPLMVYLKGFALADDLPGRLPREILTREFRLSHPLRRVASYGSRAAEAAAAAAGSDPEMLERLRALGYIQ